MQADLHLPALFLNLANRKAREMLGSGFGINTVVLATVDGFPVVSAVPQQVDAERIAALASSISSIGAVATQEAALGRCTSVILNTDDGFAVVRHFQAHGKELVLISVADRQSLLAQVMYQSNDLVKEVSAV